MKVRKSFIAALVVALLAGGGYRFADAQQSGGAFIPSFDYIISAAWTWTSASPFVFEGATDNTFETTLAITDPTADRTLTLPNSTGTLARTASDTFTSTTMTAPTITSPNISGAVSGGASYAAPTLTTPTITSGISGSGTYTFPSNTGGMPIVVNCGPTGTANCGNTAAGANAKVFYGTATMTAGSATISGLSPTFTTTTSGACIGIDQSGSSGVLAEVVISGVSSLTVSGTGSGVVWYMCVGVGG